MQPYQPHTQLRWWITHRTSHTLLTLILWTTINQVNLKQVTLENKEKYRNGNTLNATLKTSSKPTCTDAISQTCYTEMNRRGSRHVHLRSSTIYLINEGTASGRKIIRVVAVVAMASLMCTNRYSCCVMAAPPAITSCCRTSLSFY